MANTPVRWDPSGHPVHRIIQLLDVLRSGLLRVRAEGAKITHPGPAADGSPDLEANAEMTAQ
ncbi:MAG: hypothetical protein ACJ8F7_02735, partial [Gemmataceae bacterium]